VDKHTHFTFHILTNRIIMLSNLNSCHGVFIPTSIQGGGCGCGSSGSNGNGVRHYRYPATTHPKNETKKNKRVKENIWMKIEEDFMPEIIKEYTNITEDQEDTKSINTSTLNIPETIQQSPKQTSSRGGGFVTETCDDSLDVADHHPIQSRAFPIKRMSALFIKSETDVECLYRKSGIREKCEVCSSDVVLTDDGFLTCKNPACSILYKDESLDQTAEWRYYGADDNQNNDPTRCGMPVNPLLKESSYGCKVMCEGGSYSQDMMKIRRYTEWQSMPYREKAQYDMFQKITTLAQNKGISKMIIDEALRVHKRISEHKTFRSLNRDGVVGASIYIACKIHNCPRTPKEIANIFNLDNTSATKGCKNAVSIINELESNLDNSEKTNFCKTKPEAFIERYCSRLAINDELTKLCQFIAVMIEKQNLIPENTPHSIASGIIYFVACMCHLPITKKDVNRISDMSEVTINKCYKKLYDMRERLIPKMIIDKYAPK